MILIEKKYKQINLILNKNKIKNNVKNNFSFLFIKIFINSNIIIKNFKQINFKKQTKKIFFFPKFFSLNNLKIKKNFLFFFSNIYIY